MANNTFDAYIERLGARTSSDAVAWGAVRDEWLQYVDTFFETIEGFLKTYIEQKKVTFEISNKIINEELIGKYEVKTGLLQIGDNEVIFDPIGANLIGAKGRIDMVGPNGIVRFLLVNKEATGPRITKGGVRRIQKDSEIIWAWKLATDPPVLRYFDLDENVFFEALIGIVNE